jgi:3-oxoacyl-[acyl-carrier-protein] synthase II
MKIYIRSSACMSAQKTFGTDNFLTDVIEYNSTRLKAIEPDYKEFIEPKLIRRMAIPKCPALLLPEPHLAVWKIR